MKIIRVTDRNREGFQEGLASLEKRATYPLGDDFFQIDHGGDYFRFFERLGKMVYYVIVEEEAGVIGAAAGIVRKLSFRAGSPPKSTFYLCDFKIEPRFRGRDIALKMAGHGFFRNYLRCPRGYAITMNDPAQETNRIVYLANKFRWASSEVAGPLLLFSLGHDEMRHHGPLLEEHRGPLSYLSLGGVKDIILQSTGEAMPLLHVQFGPCAEPGHPEPLPEHTHMFCSLAGDPLTKALEARGVAPSATAAIIFHRMPDCDWRFILTSDI
jgi:hypothetical protein